MSSPSAHARRIYVPPRRGILIPRIELPIPGGGGTILGFGVAAAIVACAFFAKGGAQLERTTYTEVAFLLAGAGLCVAALLLPRPERTPVVLRGGWVLVTFALLAVFTAFSVNWSLMPNDSWLEATRTLSYFAVLAGGLALGRLRPGSWTALLAGVAISAVTLAGWSVLTKVFPAAFATEETFARLRPPFDYWNSVGLAAALGVPALVWLGSRRSGHAALNALAWPGLGLLVMSLMLAVSRGALLAVGIGTVIWLIVVPLRMRAAVMIGGVLVTTLPLVAWAFAQDGIMGDNARMALRTDAGQGFGALLLLMLVTLSVAGLAVGFITAVKPPGPQTVTRATRVLVGALAVVPAVAILMLANAPGGISGQVSKAWHQATDPAISGPTNSPERLTATSSGRARYWSEAMKIHGQAPWLGTGAGSYGTLRLRYRLDGRAVQHAHGYVVQTLADLGWIGLGLSLLAAGAWLTSAVRTVGLRRGDRGVPWDAERVGLATLAVIVIVFGVHSTIDWTWFVPGNVLPALLCAGWVASRATLRERVSGLEQPTRALARPVLVGAAVVVSLIGLVAAWSALQPVRSDHARTASLNRLDKGEMVAAASIARTAHDRNPLAVEPLFDLSAIEQATGRNPEAKRALDQAIDLEPANPETWRQLGRLQIDGLDDPKAALRSFQIAYYLDPRSKQSTTDIVVASRLAAARLTG